MPREKKQGIDWYPGNTDCARAPESVSSASTVPADSSTKVWERDGAANTKQSRHSLTCRHKAGMRAARAEEEAKGATATRAEEQRSSTEELSSASSSGLSSSSSARSCAVKPSFGFASATQGDFLQKKPLPLAGAPLRASLR